MSNPVFTKNPVFTERTPAGYPAMPGYTVGGPATHSGSTPATYPPANTSFGQQFPPENLGTDAQPQFGSNTETTPARQSRPLTMDDVLIKTIITFGALLIGGAVSWFATATNPGLGGMFMIVGTIAAFVLAMVNSFKRKVSPALVLAYAAFEGIALGAISFIFSTQADGVVGKAILATLVTTLVMLILFKTKVVRNSPTLMRVTMIGLVSIAAVYLVNFVISLIAPSWSMYSITIAGFPLWIVVSLVAVVLAALSLVTDFDFIVQAVENRAPAETAWMCAFGLMVTLVWLYLEFLKLFAYFAANRD